MLLKETLLNLSKRPIKGIKSLCQELLWLKNASKKSQATLFYPMFHFFVCIVDQGNLKIVYNPNAFMEAFSAKFGDRN